MTNETVEKAKADVKKGMAEVGKAAANLKDEMEWLKANIGHNTDEEKKADATRIVINSADTGASSDLEKKKTDTEESRDTVESIFGANAGIVWEALNLKGSMTIDDLVKATALNPEEIYGALGWLGRENKILVKTRGIVRFFSLRS